MRVRHLVRRKRHPEGTIAYVEENEGIQLELTTFLPSREQLGIEIATAGDSIRKITKNYYKVRSQSANGWYNVKKLEGADVWTCECSDFLYRLTKEADKRCKHIIAVQTLQMTFDTESKIEPVLRAKICSKCLSPKIVKQGFRIIKNRAKRQRYRCNQCGFRFILGENGFSRVSSEPQLISEALNLIYAGLSYRIVARHISISHQTKVSHVSIMNWFRKYTKLMKEYVDHLIPEFSQVWSVDEMMVNVKDTTQSGVGFYDWMWSIISPQTRFVIASEVSKRREEGDAKAIFQSGKRKTESNPSYVITDSLRTYEPAFRKEFNVRKTAHVKTKSIQEGFTNKPIERYHNEVRAVLKTKRGLGNDKSAQEFADGQRIYHNFCRPHTGLRNGITPAQAAGIDLSLGENKIKALIEKSAEVKQETTRDYNIEIQLGKRAEYVNISHEKDCISVTPKMWINKSLWREINDILTINGFVWLENGGQSEWIKMKQQGSSDQINEATENTNKNLRRFGFS
jgi:transposase-like protein